MLGRRTVIMSKKPSEKPPALPKLSSSDGKSTEKMAGRTDGKSTEKNTGRPHLSHRGGKPKSSHRGDSSSGLQSDRKQSGAVSHRDKTVDKSGRMDQPKAKALHHRALMSSVAEAPAAASPEVSVPDLVDAASFDDGLEQPPSPYDEPPALESELVTVFEEAAAAEEGASSEMVRAGGGDEAPFNAMQEAAVEDVAAIKEAALEEQAPDENADCIYEPAAETEAAAEVAAPAGSVAEELQLERALDLAHNLARVGEEPPPENLPKGAKDLPTAAEGHAVAAANAEEDEEEEEVRASEDTNEIKPLWQHDFRLGTTPDGRQVSFVVHKDLRAEEWRWAKPRIVGETALELTRDAAVLLQVSQAAGAGSYPLARFTLTLDVQLQQQREDGTSSPFALLCGEGDEPLAAVQTGCAIRAAAEGATKGARIVSELRWMRWHRVVIVFSPPVAGTAADADDQRRACLECAMYVDGELRISRRADVSSMWVRGCEGCPYALKLFGGGKHGGGGDVPELRLAYVSLLPVALDAAGVKAHAHRGWAFDANAAVAKLQLTNRERRDLQLHAVAKSQGTKASPLWHSQPFIAEFCDPFLARTGLDSSLKCDESLGTLTHALSLLCRKSLHELDRVLDAQQLETLKGAINTLTKALPLWQQYATHVGAFVKQAREWWTNDGYAEVEHTVAKTMRALKGFVHDEGERLLIPCGWKTKEEEKTDWYFIVMVLEPEDRPSTESPSRSFRLTICNAGGEATEYHGSKVVPPKVKHRGSVSVCGVRAERLLDEAFWTMLYGLTGKFHNRCNKSGGAMIYDVLLPWLLEQPTDAAIAATYAREEGGEWRTPMYSATSHYRSLLEVVRYMLRRGLVGGRAKADYKAEGALSKQQVKFVTFALRSTFLSMVKSDLKVVRAVGPQDRALIELATQQVALAAVKGADGGTLDPQELCAVHTLIEEITKAMDEKPQLSSPEAFVPLSLNNMEAGKVSATLFPYFDRVVFKDVCGKEGAPVPVPKGLGVDMLGLRERATSSEELVRALNFTEELCLQISSLDAAGAVRHAAFVKLNLLQHVFTYIVPVPMAAGVAPMTRPHPWDFGPNLKYGQQLELLLLLQRLSEHFVAAAFSLKATKALDGVKIVILGCMVVACDYLVRLRACDRVSLVTITLAGEAVEPELRQLEDDEIDRRSRQLAEDGGCAGEYVPYTISASTFLKQSETFLIVTPELNVTRADVHNYLQAQPSNPQRLLFDWEADGWRMEPRRPDMAFSATVAACEYRGTNQTTQSKLISGEDSFIVHNFEEYRVLRDGACRALPQPRPPALRLIALCCGASRRSCLLVEVRAVLGRQDLPAAEGLQSRIGPTRVGAQGAG